jgi:hypothetical protein
VKSQNLNRKQLHTGRAANELAAAVAKSRSKKRRREFKNPLESFRLRWCKLSSTASGNVPSDPTPPAKQAFTAKHLSIGSGEVRLAMMVTTSSGKDLHGDLNAASQRSTRPTIMSSGLRGKLHSEAPSTRTTRFSWTLVATALTRTRRMKTETLL